MRRYLTLLSTQIRASMAIAFQYRVDFFVQGIVSVFWIAMALIPLRIVFSEDRPTLAGWTYPESLVVLAWFTLLKSLLEGAINPSLLAVVDHIRKGTLDFVLLKPADAQFLVSTSRFEPWRIADALAALAIFGFAFAKMGRLPSPQGIAAALAMLVLAALILYSLWILVISAAFHVVRIDNLSFLFAAIFDAGRWPINIFTRPLRLLFTFVIPLALMTTFPALALLGRLPLSTLGLGALGSVAFAFAARRVWLGSLGRYTSAGG